MVDNYHIKMQILFSSYARLFNYKDKSYIYSINDKEKYGIKQHLILILLQHIEEKR